MEFPKAIFGWGGSFGLDGVFHSLFRLFGLLDLLGCLGWGLFVLFQIGNDTTKLIAAIFVARKHIER